MPWSWKTTSSFGSPDPQALPGRRARMRARPAGLRRVCSLALLSAVAAGCCAASVELSPVQGRQRALEAAGAPSGFVYVPGSYCRLGTADDDADSDHRPLRRVFLPSFYIGRLEVSEAEWKRFRPEHTIHPGREQYPITRMTREDAEAYCQWVGGYLPTEDQWEKAARGENGRRYPWGDVFDPDRCNVKRNGQHTAKAICTIPGIRKGLRPVDSFPTGASPYGALQMAGNAWEWVVGTYDGNPERHLIRGGAHGYSERSARTYERTIEGAGVT